MRTHARACMLHMCMRACVRAWRLCIKTCLCTLTLASHLQASKCEHTIVHACMHTHVRRHACALAGKQARVCIERFGVQALFRSSALVPVFRSSAQYSLAPWRRSIQWRQWRMLVKAPLSESQRCCDLTWGLTMRGTCSKTCIRSFRRSWQAPRLRGLESQVARIGHPLRKWRTPSRSE